MNKNLRISLFVLIPVVFIGAFLLRDSLFQSEEGPSQNTVETSSNPNSNVLGVRAIKLDEQSFSNRIFTTGSIVAIDEVQLRSESSGRITQILVGEGKSVEKGELLVKINDAELQAQLLRTELQLELAELREERQKNLLENRAISQEDYDVALNQVNTIKAEIELIKAQIEKTEIRAPFNGVIGLHNVSVGSYVTPTTIIATFQDLSRIEIDFSIPERYVGFVRVGDEIEFTRQGSSSNYRGKVVAIEPRIERTTRTLLLRAQAPNPGQAIIPGAFAEIQFQLREIPDAIMVPSEAVIPELGGNSIFVLRDGVASRKSIQTGTRTETLVQVTDGLVAGDTILTTGILQLREGMPVRVTELIDQANQEL